MELIRENSHSWLVAGRKEGKAGVWESLQSILQCAEKYLSLTCTLNYFGNLEDNVELGANHGPCSSQRMGQMGLSRKIPGSKSFSKSFCLLSLLISFLKFEMISQGWPLKWA